MADDNAVQNADEPKIDYKRDIQGKSFAQIADETVKQVQKDIAKDTAKETEEKPKEEAKEPKGSETKEPEEKQPTPPEPKRETPDTTETIQQTAKATAEEVSKTFKDALVDIETSRATEAQKQSAREELEAKWSKEGRNPQDYNEIYTEAKTHAVEEAKQWFTEQEAKKEKAAEEAKKAEDARQADIKKQQDDYRLSVEKIVEDEFNELVRDGVVKEGDKDALFKKGLEINEQRAKEGKPYILSVARIYYNYYKDKAEVKQPAGADAPIAGNNTAGSPAESEKIDMREIRNNSFAQIARNLIKR